MKLKILAVLVAAGMAASAFGQGVILDNLGNAGGVSAVTGGRVYLDPDGPGGAAPVLFDGINFNLGVEVFGGPALASMGVFRAATDPKGYTGADIGQFQLGVAGAAINVPGAVAGNPAQIQLNIWYDGVGGLFPSYAAAYGGGGLVGSVTFQQATSNPGGQPPVPATGLGSMPSVVLMVAPEPSTLALGAMGLASLLIFRRRS